MPKHSAHDKDPLGHALELMSNAARFFLIEDDTLVNFLKESNFDVVINSFAMPESLVVSAAIPKVPVMKHASMMPSFIAAAMTNIPITLS